jgi:hypothetical protein
VEILFPFIAAVSEPIQQDLYFQQLAAFIGVDEGTLKASTGRFVNRSGGSGSAGTRRSPKQAGREVEPTASPFAQLDRDPIEEYCLALALQNPELVPVAGLVPEHFRRPENRELARHLEQMAQNPPEDITGQRLKQSVDPALQEQLDSLLAEELPPVKARNRLMVLESAVKRLEQRFLRELKIEEAMWFSEEQLDILEEPNPAILDVNQRIKGNESTRSWLDRKTLSGR